MEWCNNLKMTDTYTHTPTASRESDDVIPSILLSSRQGCGREKVFGHRDRLNLVMSCLLPMQKGHLQCDGCHLGGMAASSRQLVALRLLHPEACPQDGFPGSKLHCPQLLQEVWGTRMVQLLLGRSRRRAGMEGHHHRGSSLRPWSVGHWRT